MSESDIDLSGSVVPVEKLEEGKQCLTETMSPRNWQSYDVIGGILDPNAANVNITNEVSVRVRMSGAGPVRHAGRETFCGRQARVNVPSETIEDAVCPSES